MAGYIVKRLSLFVPTLILVSLVVFFVMRILPGDPALVLLMGDTGEGGAVTEEELAVVRAKLGTDKPLYTQYGIWMWGLVRGDFGQSYWYNDAVADHVKARFPITLELAVMSLIIAFIISVPLGVISAVKQDKWPDNAAKLFTITGVAMPTFWVGVLMIYFLARVFDWLPPIGYEKLWDDPLTNLQQLIFPALALGYFNTAFTARVTRSAMLEVLREDYIRTARSKGLKEFIVVSRHALKNAFLPVITVSGWQFSRLIGGAVLIEIIFRIPGMGIMMVESISHRDFPIIQAFLMTVAALVLLLNLLVDLSYGWLDPKVRYA
jgi:peptide/nickel transport system permease protein